MDLILFQGKQIISLGSNNPAYISQLFKQETGRFEKTTPSIFKAVIKDTSSGKS
jgi:hypothetical protein